MSDWEDYCDSKGFNAGRADDYEAWLDSMDESAGFRQKKPIIKACEPTLSQDELIELMYQAACTGTGLQQRIDMSWCTSGGDLTFDAMDGNDERNLGILDLEIEVEHEQRMPIAFLVEAIKRSGIPFFTEVENGWIAWDTQDRCIRTEPFHAFRYKDFSSTKSMYRDKVSPNSKEGEILDFMKKCARSTDHGMKPLLVRRFDIDEVARKREVDFLNPKIIRPHDTDDYMLAYYDASSAVRFIQLREVIKLGVPVHIRNANYYEHKGTLYSNISAASLLANGYLMATKHNFKEFDYFRVRERGTVFHSVIERIEAPKTPYMSFSTLENLNPFLNVAECIAQWSGERIDPVYVTNGGHPLEAELITTPEMLLNAIQKLDDYGFVADHVSRDKVEVRRKSEIVTKLKELDDLIDDLF